MGILGRVPEHPESIISSQQLPTVGKHVLLFAIHHGRVHGRIEHTLSFGYAALSRFNLDRIHQPVEPVQEGMIVFSPMTGSFNDQSRADDTPVCSVITSGDVFELCPLRVRLMSPHALTLDWSSSSYLQ